MRSTRPPHPNPPPPAGEGRVGQTGRGRGSRIPGSSPRRRVRGTAAVVLALALLALPMAPLAHEAGNKRRPSLGRPLRRVAGRRVRPAGPRRLRRRRRDRADPPPGGNRTSSAQAARQPGRLRSLSARAASCVYRDAGDGAKRRWICSSGPSRSRPNMVQRTGSSPSATRTATCAGTSPRKSGSRRSITRASRWRRASTTQARAHRVLELEPSFTVSSFLAGNFTNEERLAMLGEALREAGLP